MEAATSISENPKRLTGMFVNEEMNRSGIYAVNLYSLQVPITIIVDDLLPINRTFMTKQSKIGSDLSTWGLILEKAVAKLHGGYEALLAGSFY